MIKGDLLNIPNNLLAKFQANEIDEIMITCMGTCHSAAVAIAANMRRHLILKQSNFVMFQEKKIIHCGLYKATKRCVV